MHSNGAAQRRFVRTGEEYKESVRDGRRVWVDGEQVADITTHPVTAGMVETHAQWYDRHQDPEWEETLWRREESGEQVPVCYSLPRSAEQLSELCEALRASAFQSAGNISHLPSYGSLIVGGLWDMMASTGIGDAGKVKDFYDWLCAETGFLTGIYVPPQVARFQSDEDRSVVRVVEERDDGIVVRGGFAIATGAVYGNVITGSPMPIPGNREEESIFYAFRPNDPGVRIFLRKPVTQSSERFSYPLSTRFDEQDAAVFLDNVFVPWERVFIDRSPEMVEALLPRHFYFTHFSAQIRVLARAEFSVGLGLAITESLGTAKIPAVEAALTDLYLQAQTIRTSLVAAIAECEVTPNGIAKPNIMHISAGHLYALENRAKLANSLRTLAGQSLITAPSAANLRDGADREFLASLFGGGPLDAEQRSLLWNAVRDHTVTTLEGREEVYTALATAGAYNWRKRVGGLAADSEQMVAGALRVIEESGGVELPIRARLGGSVRDASAAA